MSDLLDFAADDSKAGFRLDRFELLNWGTFDRRVWRLEAKGENTLLTGDIGSGKSTLVDALTTLLVPPQRLAYNKAAGAEARERSLRSYVLGHFKSERSESGLSAKAVALRDYNSHSVILGHFHNEGFRQDCCLAQVFWIRDPAAPPSRFYVYAERPLDIAGHFADFGSDIADLKKRLRQLPGVELFDSYAQYAAVFRRRFGLANEQALELFNQTVSMKSVGNLTDFVREHMLEDFDASGRIEALIHHFDDLNRAHEAVLKAKQQLAALEPLLADCRQQGALEASRESLRALRDALSAWFARRKDALLAKRLQSLAAESERLEAKLAAGREEARTLKADRDNLRQAIADNGGDRLERIRLETEQAAAERDRRRGRLERYALPAGALGLPVPRDAEGFAENRRRAQEIGAGLADQEAALQNRLTDAAVALRNSRENHERTSAELASLRERRSNIPAAQIAIRQRLCDELGLPAAELPFAGELLRVDPREQAWEGAIERVLRNFALSLLVPDQSYPAVSAWVDANHLNGRLVYYRVRERQESPEQELHPASLMRKLTVKPGAALANWLERELARRFDYACCADLAQFHRERQAITRQGQIKGQGERHEKDDRSRVDDAGRYVLGWANEAKIALLARRQAELEEEIRGIAGALSAGQAEQAALRGRRDQLVQLAGFVDWAELDWQALSQRVAALQAEQAALEAAADTLRALGRQLEAVEAAQAANEAAMDRLKQEKGAVETKTSQAAELRAGLAELLAEGQTEKRQASFPAIEALAAGRDLLRNLSVESCDNREKELRELVQGDIDAEDKKLVRLRERIISAMQAFRSLWPLETRELDASLAAAGAWQALLDQLRADDLPRFERDFKRLLNENTIREVANFQSQLNRERQDIRERIERINQSLTRIDYNPGRYIVLESQNSGDGEIRDFVADLRACTEGSLTGSGDEQYSEAKFLQVKRIIERFRGREGFSELDRRWTAKVSDVRQYFCFSASERWREDGSEHEHYTDSGGKSGGQKEKLAYTVLAASLAYQFGLEWGEVKSRSFRFVMIDEAFGRGSDESARYGLELFRQLGLQLLVITPLQKIHIIEPYVASVGFVSNEGGRQSRLRNLSIEEYREGRLAAKAGQGAGTAGGTDGAAG
jgi:uncharacterized protein YPO0396